MPSPLEAMRVVATRLGPLEIPFAFVGGAVISVLVDQPVLTEIRPTKDVDVIVQVTTLLDYYALEERLRSHGFQHDLAEDAPICRWIVEDCRADIMPTTPAALGMDSRWFPEALATAVRMDLGKGCPAHVIHPALFIATKLEAFKNRGRGDFYASHDLEDIIALVDGRASIVHDVAEASEEVRLFVAMRFREIMDHPDFWDAFPGHLSTLSRDRASVIRQRLRSLGG